MLSRIINIQRIQKSLKSFSTFEQKCKQITNQYYNKEYQLVIKNFLQLEKNSQNLSIQEKNEISNCEKLFISSLQKQNTFKQENSQKQQFYLPRFYLIVFGLYIYYTYKDVLPWSSAKEKPTQISAIQQLLGMTDEIEMQKNIETRFTDVLGIDEFKEELLDIVDFLKNPQKYKDAGARLPKGILLSGPPGTGKTLLARALAGESGCSFFYKSGSEFDEMFVGVGASRVRQLFQKARQNSPSIIFIDEIDSIAGDRKYSNSKHANDTINQILTEMDGFIESDNVIVIGATNFEKSIDPAILRPGRFDKIINVPYPDVKGRQQIFDYYLKKIKINQINSDLLARQTTGFTGADIQNMVNVAILEALRNNRTTAESHDFEFAKDRIRMGIARKSLQISDKDKLITAYHEGGHALISVLTLGSTPLHKVTILPRGGALGFTSMVPSHDQQVSQTKRNFLSQIDVAMGGKAAEELLMGDKEVSSGCSSDLQNATKIAYQFVMQFGMNEDFSLMALTEKGQASDKYQFIVDQEVQKMLSESYTRVKSLLQDNFDVLEKIANELLIKETLLAEDIIQLTKK